MALGLLIVNLVQTRAAQRAADAATDAAHIARDAWDDIVTFLPLIPRSKMRRQSRAMQRSAKAAKEQAELI